MVNYHRVQHAPVPGTQLTVMIEKCVSGIYPHHLLGFRTKVVGERDGQPFLRYAYQGTAQPEERARQAANDAWRRWQEQEQATAVAPVAAPPTTKSITVTVGVFEHGDAVYVVRAARKTKRLFASKVVESPPRMTESGLVVDFELVYTPGKIYDLDESERMTLATAADLMTKYGRCLICGRPLKAAESVAKGVGPICAKRFA